jgi:divalent metal cation (Fe/Co/Zn/Cd) transporter
LSKKWLFIDAILGIFIALYIIYSAYGLFIQATKNLIDEEFDDEQKSKILAILTSYDQDIFGVHELKTRYAGSKPFIQFHMEMNGNITLLKAHEISENIATEIEKQFPGAEVTIHQDPVGVETDVKYREVL